MTKIGRKWPFFLFTLKRAFGHDGIIKNLVTGLLRPGNFFSAPALFFPSAIFRWKFFAHFNPDPDSFLSWNHFVQTSTLWLFPTWNSFLGQKYISGHFFFRHPLAKALASTSCTLLCLSFGYQRYSYMPPPPPAQKLCNFPLYFRICFTSLQHLQPLFTLLAPRSLNSQQTCK